MFEVCDNDMRLRMSIVSTNSLIEPEILDKIGKLIEGKIAGETVTVIFSCDGFPKVLGYFTFKLTWR